MSTTSKEVADNFHNEAVNILTKHIKEIKDRGDISRILKDYKKSITSENMFERIAETMRVKLGLEKPLEKSEQGQERDLRRKGLAAAHNIDTAKEAKKILSIEQGSKQWTPLIEQIQWGCYRLFTEQHKWEGKLNIPEDFKNILTGEVRALSEKENEALDFAQDLAQRNENEYCKNTSKLTQMIQGNIPLNKADHEKLEIIKRGGKGAFKELKNRLEALLGHSIPQSKETIERNKIKAKVHNMTAQQIMDHAENQEVPDTLLYTARDCYNQGKAFPGANKDFNPNNFKAFKIRNQLKTEMGRETKTQEEQSQEEAPAI